MPIHSKTRSSAADGAAASKKKTVDMSSASKRGPGGVKKSMRAVRAEAKNACLVKDVLSICRGAKTSDDMAEAFAEADLTLARVLAAPGGRHLDVVLMDGRKTSVPISGVVAFRGAVRTKGHLPNFMGAGDLVILYGAHARGKIPYALIADVRKMFVAVKYPTPAGFFPEEHEGGDGWEFDREEQSAWAETMCGAAIIAAKESSDHEDDDTGDFDIDAI